MNKEVDEKYTTRATSAAAVERIFLWIHSSAIKHSEPLEEWCDYKCLGIIYYAERLKITLISSIWTYFT